MTRHGDAAEWHEQARKYFDCGWTQPASFRQNALKKLGAALQARRRDLLQALKKDLGKPAAEACLAEVGWVQNDIRHARRHLGAWMRPQRCRIPLGIRPGRGWVEPQPAGLVLVMAPWNYPLQLLFSPLVAALAAGNVVCLKPSEKTPTVSHALADLVRATFPEKHVVVCEGGKETAESLLALQFDRIFFTGSPEIGRRVLTAAARFLTPVTLELGGKSPCIVCADADLEVTARRIAWGKFMNAGQVCVAPDYVLCDRTVREALVKALRKAIDRFYGADPSQSGHYARLVSVEHAERMQLLAQCGTVAHGGACDPAQRYMAPTLLLDPPADSRVMREEIFGPILPLVAFDDLGGALREVRRRPAPLALYLFTRNKQIQKRVRRETVSGGMAINDTLVQIFSREQPFGGVGQSGMGAYHGRAGFDTFSHRRAVVQRAFRPDFSFRYPPVRAPLWILRLANRFLLQG